MSFQVSIADTGESAPAEGGDTVLNALLEHGVGFAYSCQAGNCGTCKCELVSGEILELDYSEHALSAAERARNIVLACRSQVWGDVVVRRLDDEDFVVHPSRLLRCRVAELERATHDVLRLRLEVLAGGPYAFSPGQFAKLSFPCAHGEERDYSMANTPDESLLEFHIRVMPEGAVSRRVSESRAQHPGPMLCISGGTGLAPIRAIVKGALDEGRTQPVHLYVGVRAERDVYYERELAGLAARHPNLQLHIVLSDAGAGASRGGPRRFGLVSDAVAADFSDLSGYKVYIAGPPPMVDAASAVARERGVAARDIHADAFFPAPAETRLTEAG
jgi:naphthalene 1,2-dioxygenase ferredoxin reductase component